MIKYKSGYKYQLVESYSCNLRRKEFLMYEVHVPFIDLISGHLRIAEGYAWDGPSGPTFDTKNFMRGSLVHDVLYQLIRQGHLHPEYRAIADLILKDMCIKDGMSKARAWWVHAGVKYGGKRAANPSNVKPIITAP